MTIKEIIMNYLKENGYDGLLGDNCACGIDDICPCDDDGLLECEPAYKTVCDRAKCWRDDDYYCDGETGGDCYTTIKPKAQNNNIRRKNNG